MSIIIESKIQPQSFGTWIQPCYISGVSEGTVTLAAPNRCIVEWVEEHYLWLIEWTVRKVDDNIQKVAVTDLTSNIEGLGDYGK